MKNKLFVVLFILLGMIVAACSSTDSGGETSTNDNEAAESITVT